MSNRSLKTTVACLVALILSTTSSIFGQSLDEDAKTELGLRHRLVLLKMQEVEKQFRSIATRLEQEQPEQAKLLTQAYQQSKEKLITQKMGRITQFLNENKLEDARALLVEVKAGLNDLVRLLTQQKAPTLSKQEEIDQLNQWKNEIQDQLRKQQRQTVETRKISDREQTLKKLDAQIEKINRLTQRQAKLIEQTEQNTQASLPVLDKIADQQFEIRKQTERLQRQIGENVGQDPKEGLTQQDTSGKNQGGETAESSAPEGGKTRGNNQKPGAAQSQTSPPKGAEQGAGQPSGQQQGDSKNQSSSAEQSGNQSQQQQPGQQELEESRQAQAEAEEKLGSAKPADAVESQKQALGKMNEAMEKLKQEKRRIESLPLDALQQLADDQRRLRDKAMEMANKIKKSPQPNNDDQATDSVSGQKPGQQSMQQAAESQQQAADATENNDADEAENQQQNAQQSMQQAIEEIEERLAQLKDETREEKLARLESRFKEMLQRQQTTSIVTIEVDDKRNVLNQLQTRDQLLMIRLAVDESVLHESAQQAYDLLLEDGTSFVFPEVVADLQDQLTNVTQLLSNEKTGAYTQLVQQEIEATINDLIDALKQAKKSGSGGGGGGGGGGGDQGNQPLLKKSAELKVLRVQQLRLNRRTKKIEQIKEQAGIDGDVIAREQTSAAELQAKLIEMTDQFLESDSP